MTEAATNDAAPAPASLPSLAGPAAGARERTAAAAPLPESASVRQAYAELGTCADERARIDAAARLILAVFDDFYAELCEYPHRALRAFETMNPQASVRISRERLGLYSRYIAEHGPRLEQAFPALARDEAHWDAIDARVSLMIVDRYEADIAVSFVHSLRRNITHGLWRPVAYSFPPPSPRRALSLASVFRRLPVRGGVDAELIAQALRVPGFTAPFRDLARDALRIAARIRRLIDEGPFADGVPLALDIVEAAFLRERRAFVVGRWVLRSGGYKAFVVALLNGPAGIYADAVLHETADVHNLFSSTLANFHVTTKLYYQTCVFLYSLMPRRPLGQHYSTIGFNHVGKVAILDEIDAQMRGSGQRFAPSQGFPGTVAVGFTFEACTYHLKIIRDRPTRAYKWGAFPGVAATIDKYRNVHEINRAGSMLDNVMYFNLRLRRDMFEPALLAQLSEEASGSVHVDGDGVVVRSLIVQLKIVPLSMYLATASEREMRAAVVNLGHCIRNNAATNIFNKDLDCRNYGVGRYGKVFLYDYDAVEKLTDVKIRTNADREPGEETPPDWFFEDGTIFLPEEIEAGLQMPSDAARRCFRAENADLAGTAYWEDVQRKLARGEVLELRTYPESTKLDARAAGERDPASPTPHQSAAGATS
jgi:isocitrate dehydrogenase kinase/phosphatase